MMNQMRSRRGRRGTKQRRPLNRTRNRLAQNGVGVSHRDNVPQVRKILFFDNLPFTNADASFSFGLQNYNITGSTEPFASIIAEYSSLYEQYRVRRVRVRATIGRGYTNDDRLKTFVAGRVDVDNQPASSTLANVQSLLYSENTVIKTFTERNLLLLADFKPTNRPTVTNYSQPVFPNMIEWYPTADVSLHTWKGTTLAALIPEVLTPGSRNLTITVEADIEFRGRITDAASFNTRSILNTIKERKVHSAPTPKTLSDLLRSMPTNSVQSQAPNEYCPSEEFSSSDNPPSDSDGSEIGDES